MNTQKSGSGARERLLESALEVFSRYGYEAATTRRIAREAGVNIAAIPYYFSSKEGLYQAVIDSIVTMIKAQVAATAEKLRRCSFSGEDAREQAIAELEDFLEKIILFMLGSPQAPRAARIILREQLYPSPSYDLIFKGFMAPILDAMTTLISVASGNPSRRIATLRAMAILGQILAFRVARETAVRALGLEGYSQNELDEIRDIVKEHTRNTLRAIR